MTDNLPEVTTKAPVPIVNGVLAPVDFDGLWRITTVICQTEIAGKYKDKPEEAFVAIQLGMSVGLNYMQALQSVAVIQGKPALYGDATTALCKASGELVEHDEYWEVDGKRQEDYDGVSDLEQWPDDVKAVVMMKRKGIKQAKIGHFSVGDARRMGKWNKHTEQGYLSVWQKHPKDMLMWRARHKAQSVLFADNLRGLIPAKIAADYDVTDVEPTSVGPTPKANPSTTEKANIPVQENDTVQEIPLPEAAEKKNIAKGLAFLIEFAQSNGLSLSRLEEFVDIIAKENNTSLEGLVPDIIARSSEFVTMFKNWDISAVAETPKGDSDQPVDDKTGSESEPPQGEPEEEKEQTEIISKEEPVETTEDIRGMLDLALVGYVEGHPEAFIDSNTDNHFSEYLDYCVEMTKRPMAEIMQLAKANPNNYCEYFFQWLVAKGVTEEAPAEEEPPPPPEKKKPAYSPLVLEFKNKTAPKFIEWVIANKERLQAADVEDFKTAVRKWETMRASGKIVDDWPYPQEQTAMSFEAGQTGATNARQRVANLKQTNPAETERARKELGFGSTVQEEAALIWEEKTHEIIEKKAKADARKKK